LESNIVLPNKCSSHFMPHRTEVQGRKEIGSCWESLFWFH